MPISSTPFEPNGPVLGQDLIHQIDFAALYRAQCQKSSFGVRSSADWDQRAERRSRGEGNADYSCSFLERMDLTGAKTVLDIGCGTGNLAIPLAKKMKTVHALDFSSEMLRLLEIQRERAGIQNIRVHRLSWEDSWKTVPAADIVICSRALSVEDLQGALQKMHQKTKMRAYLTIHAGGSYLGSDVMNCLGRKMEPRPDYIYAVNVLWQMGIRARVDFLKSQGGLTYSSAEDFVGAVRWRVGELSRAETSRLNKFFLTLPLAEDGRRQVRHDFVWAMLSWEKSL